jgi:hypothetical protein
MTSKSLSVGQLQGLFPSNEIELASDTKLIVDGILRVNTIQNTSGLTIVSSTGNTITFAGSITTTGQISAVNVAASGRFILPTWTTSTRPTTNLVNGLMGLNTERVKVEAYSTAAGWIDVQQSTTSTQTKQIPTNGLILRLDATDTASYPGSGAIWYDTSGINNNFNVNASAFNTGGKYFDFNGSFGCAKNSSDISLSGDVTYVTVTRMRNSTSNWRTLTRSYVNDHHVMGQDGGWAIGIYDNDSAGFISTGYSQQSLPGYASNSFMVMIWRWTNNDNPTYSMYVNGSTVGTITNSNARYNRGFGSIGAYHNGNTNVGDASQGWGDIKFFAAYNRRLSDSECDLCYAQLSSLL